MKGFTNIDGVWVENKIFSTYFSCDYEKCRGACCWVKVDDEELDGGSVMKDEAIEITEKRLAISEYCSEEYKQPARIAPLYKREGKFYTKLAEDGSCVYVNKEKGTCACKLAHTDGKLSFPIPRYCHLYPLWIFERKGETFLRLMDTFDSFCKPAFVKGSKENTRVYQFCKDSITRFFSERFYDKIHFEAVKSQKQPF